MRHIGKTLSKSLGFRFAFFLANFSSLLTIGTQMVTVTAESGSILKPYILRATYQWCLDFGFSPCIQAIVCPNTRVPRDYVESGMIILNISISATALRATVCVGGHELSRFPFPFGYG